MLAYHSLCPFKVVRVVGIRVGKYFDLQKVNVLSEQEEVWSPKTGDRFDFQAISPVLIQGPIITIVLIYKS